MNGLTIQEPKIKPLQALSVYNGYNYMLYVLGFNIGLIFRNCIYCNQGLDTKNRRRTITAVLRHNNNTTNL